jgi:hypothetical protein
MPVAMIRIVHVDTVGCYVKAHRRILGFEGKPSSVIVVTHGFNIPRETSFSHVAPWPFSIVSTSVPSKCFNRMEGVFVIHHSWKFQPRQRSIGIDTGAPIWPSWEHRIMCVCRYIEIETIGTKLVCCARLRALWYVLASHLWAVPTCQHWHSWIKTPTRESLMGKPCHTSTRCPGLYGSAW